MKPMSHQQRCYVQKHHCFLLRNYEKVKKAKDQARLTAEKEAELERSSNKQGYLLFFLVLWVTWKMAEISVLSHSKILNYFKHESNEENMFFANFMLNKK